jgi:hypothetical protein
MLTPVTPWSATVSADIKNAAPIHSLERGGYKFQLFNAGDSLWLTADWPNRGQMAFRLAFGMNSDFEKVAVIDINDGVLITARMRLGSYRITIAFPETPSVVLRYTTTFRAAYEMLIPFWPRDIVPLTSDGRIENTTGKIHAHQEGGRSGLMYFSYTRPRTGSVFYFQNLTAMSEYCKASETVLTDCVGGQWPEIGFQFPINKEKPMPAGIEYVISDAFVLFDDKLPEDNFDIAGQFLSYLAEIYLLLPKPEPHYHDWPAIAAKSLEDLTNNKGCWTQVEGNPYLNAYVSDYKTPAEIMVQLALLLPLQEYLGWKEDKHPIWDDLSTGLASFYDDRVKSLVRWHPALVDDLDKSEEQKQEMVMDSWYLHHPMANLGRIAKAGDKNAAKLFLDSIEYVIRVAHHFDYEWPVFYRMTTLEVIKAETEPGKGGEKDVPGSYAHVMLLAWQLTGEKRYINEAVKAIKKLGGLAFDIFYQANNTAFAAAALLELYKETNELHYLHFSHCCLAGILRNVQLWDCGYGFGEHFPNFFAVFPLKDAPYTAAYEEFEVYAGLGHFLLTARDMEIELPRPLQILLAEFVKYAAGRLAYYYPTMLPASMISDEVKTGEIQKDLWIPLEDIRDGWEKSGSVGQEVYGAGLAMGIVPRQYYNTKNGLRIFSEYPALNFRESKRALTFHVVGDAALSSQLRIARSANTAVKDFFVEAKSGNEYSTLEKKAGVFEVPGGAMVRIRWKY